MYKECIILHIAHGRAEPDGRSAYKNVNICLGHGKHTKNQKVRLVILTRLDPCGLFRVMTKEPRLFLNLPGLIGIPVVVTAICTRAKIIYYRIVQIERSLLLFRVPSLGGAPSESLMYQS